MIQGKKLVFIRELLLVLICHEFLKSVQSANGVIWSKTVGNFVPIFNIPVYAAMNKEILRKSREQETHNFQGKIIRLSYIEEINIINVTANGTRVTGAIGEIWNTLSEYLNFTLKPVHSKEKTLGVTAVKGTKYITGLFGDIQMNNTDVIAKVEAHSKRLTAVQFTNPFWTSRIRFYIRPNVTYLLTWMLKLFSRKVWYATLWTYLLLCFCSYLSQWVGIKIYRQKFSASLYDHFFYNFGMICDQGYLPDSFSKSSSMVELWLGIFSCLIRTAFGTLLISYMTQTVMKPPFQNFNSLLDTTTYNVLTLRGSWPDLLIQNNLEPAAEKAKQKGRYFTVKTLEELYVTVCLSKKLYAIYQNEDIKKAMGMYICQLNPVGEPGFDISITSGISWNFKYKKSIDVGIIKLYEFGIMQLLKHRWIESKNVEEKRKNEIDAINMEQVCLIMYILGGGFLIAFMILIFENLVFYCNK